MSVNVRVRMRVRENEGKMVRDVREEYVACGQR